MKLDKFDKFDSVYCSKEVTSKNMSELPEETLLTFLGYTREVTTRHKTSTSGGETTLTYKGNGQYVVGKNPTFYYGTDYYKAVYTAPEDYTRQQKGLMNALHEQIGNKYTSKENVYGYLFPQDRFDPIKAPYLPVSVEEYYKDKVRFPGEFEDGIGCLTGIILGIVLFLGLAVCKGPELSTAALLGIPALICLGLFLLGLIVKGIRRSIYGYRTPFELLPKEQKEEYREKYLGYIAKKYHGRAGEILQQFAVERGYDKI